MATKAPSASLDSQFFRPADDFFPAHQAVALTYDDLTLATQYSEILPRDTQLETRLADSLVRETAPLGWTPYRPLSAPSACGHIVSLRHPTAAVEEVQAALGREHRIITSSRVGGIRVSLHIYNSEDDVRALSEALESIGRHQR